MEITTQNSIKSDAAAKINIYREPKVNILFNTTTPILRPETNGLINLSIG